MSIIDLARPAAPLSLINSDPTLFAAGDDPETPCMVSLPGSSNLDLQLFSVTATGSVKPALPGTLTMTLYGMAKKSFDASDASNPSAWLPLASTPGEPIGGPDELSETMWMLQGADLMVFMASGKMQGTFKSNVASSPQPPADLTQHPRDIENTDPLYIFTIGATFAPTEAGKKRNKQEDLPPICELKMEAFSIDGN